MFDFAAFLRDHWQTPAELHRFLLKYGVRDYGPQAVYKWWIRDSIPAEGFAVLTGLLEIRQGEPVSLAKYVKS